MIKVILIIVLGIYVVYITYVLYQTKREVDQAKKIVEDILKGNLHRRILNKPGRITAAFFSNVNKLVINYQNDMIRMRKIEQANRQLMTNLAHDLKTPATTLTGYLEAMKNQALSEDEKKYYVDMAHSRIVLLNEYIEMHFEWFQLHSQERSFVIEKHDINELSRSLLCLWINELECKNFKYKFDIDEDPLYVNLDSRAYARVLNNIVLNAVRHSHGSEIEFRIWRDSEHIYVSLEDNGIGIAEEEQARIFERNYRCEEAKDRNGTGLGLAIVKEIMRAHGGRVEVSSVPRLFTCFILSFRHI